MANGPNEEPTGLSALLQLEGMARSAQSDKALQFLIVNETRKLINYRQAFLFSARGRQKKKFKVEAASSLSVIDQNSPFIDWLNRIVATIVKKKDPGIIQPIDANSTDGEFKEGWQEYSLPFVLWSPLTLPDGTVIGGLWLARETAWTENEITLIKRLSDAYAHAWGALLGRKYFFDDSKLKKYLPLAIIALIFLCGLIPVRMSVLAPVEIVAKNPMIISAPIDGVIADIPLAPNSRVKKSDSLLLYEDTALRNQFEIAKKSLSVTQAELRKAKQAAFGDRKSKADIALLESELELGRAELNYAKELLSQVEVTAEKAGILIYTDKDEWIGRSVKIGERIMEIADPEHIKLKVELPVADAIVLNQGADIDIFLDIAPLNSMSAVLTETTYNAEITASDVLAYRLYAEFTDQNNDLRIGLQGTAKIYGDKVPLFFYLFRRPISAVRQFIGI